MRHSADLIDRPGGLCLVRCSCGWRGPYGQTREEAVDTLLGHLLLVAVTADDPEAAGSGEADHDTEPEG